MPPWQTRQANTPLRPSPGMRRKARVGRVAGGRPPHPDRDQVITAKAKVCPHWGHGVPAARRALQAVYDTIKVSPVKPIVTRVERYGGWWAGCGQSHAAPVPVGMAPGTPFGASIQHLATYLPSNSHGRRLQKRSAKIQDHLCLFLDDAAAPPTNNSSAQGIRMRTVFRKVTKGFRFDWGRNLFAAVSRCREYRQTPGTIRVSGPPEGAFPQ